MNKQYNPAKEYTLSQAYALQEAQYMDWVSYLPKHWCKSFCMYGLLPFLKHHGYTLGYTDKELYALVTEWAFAHVQLTSSGSIAKTRRFMDCYHSGGEEEHAWFLFKIPSHEWLDFANQWSTHGFLDDSDAGHSQSMDLPIFIWHLINLQASPSHHEWVRHNDTMNYQDELQGIFHSNTEDSHHPYGGERRPY